MTVLANVVAGPPEGFRSAPLYRDRVSEPDRISYATYFNAFPAAYWSHWTDVTEVTLRVNTRGRGRIEVFRTDRTSQSRVVFSESVDGESVTETTLSLTGLASGGWFWIDLLPDGELELLDATWSTESQPRTEAKASIGITTLNKPDYCVKTLAVIADSPEARSVLDVVYVIDQGTNKVAEYEGFDAVAEKLGDQLRVIDQPNLGGSGGFSRSMLETLDAGQSGFTLILDDDVEVDPEAIFRLVQFGRYTREPTIVGGHMFDMFNPTVLHAWAEIIKPKYFMWGPSSPVHFRHDLSERNLRATTWMHSRDDADYTGWWMCLIPVEAMREIGLSLPAFIKWDDAEYSVRAREHGISTVSLPGSALWHIAWVDKDDSREWQSYFHARNRIIAAMLHSTFKGGGKVISNLGRIDVKHLLCMEYYAASLREMAYRDVLLGPDHLHQQLGTILDTLRGVKSDFVENHIYGTPQEIPDSRLGRLTFDIEIDSPPNRPQIPAFTAKHVARQLALPSPPPDSMPEAEFVRRDATWWRMPRYDAVVVTDSPRTTAVVYRRDRAFFREQLRRSRAALAAVEKNWDTLAAQYREALPQITSPEAWRATLLGEK